VEQRQQLLQKWDAPARRLHPRMEITGERLTLGAGTVLAGMARDGRGRPRLALDDEQRALALLATAYDWPVEPYVVAKMCRAAELWNDGDEALAHIHLAFARLPPATAKTKCCGFSSRRKRRRQGRHKARPSALAIEPASGTPEGLRSSCAAAPHIHVGCEGRGAHVFGRKARFDKFLGA
jgi:hypothetical protein